MTLYIDNTFGSKVAQFMVLVTDANLEIRDNHTISNVALPAIELSRVNNLLASGLCHVTRQIVKDAINSERDKNKKNCLESYLGYKQNCLKACAAVSSWTKFCEVDFPIAVKKLKKQLVDVEAHITLPDAFVKLEKEFLVIKKTPNVTKYFSGRKKDLYSIRDNVKLSCENTFHSLHSVVAALGLKTVCTCKSSNKLLENINDEMLNIKSNEDINWPYLCGLTITIADLIIFAVMWEFLFVMLPCSASLEQFFKKLPQTYKWFLRCASHPGVLPAACNVYKLRETSCACSNSVKCFSFPNGHEILKHVSFEEKASNPKQMHIKITKSLPRILDTLQYHKINPSFNNDEPFTSIPWEKLPSGVNPAEGELKEQRALRKRQQIENMASRVLPQIRSGDEVVDFCAGGGHLGNAFGKQGRIDRSSSVKN
ncbi:glutathione S-transferase C-terminal domain-containing protein-like isoform X2 [Hydractinia symbiolongicarpus]|uniref:glutathione S-transferase C-terminal domain-containing protein-like isoform X2 n=1 Tax=Hydractinia symbiolongicarpus TaxID=13093 RepID=UPI00254A22E3|nr:glutathione S-transferase C-terminal domain-containing protein-like isoform X2 [Hydractinia symbiolongicarpus]